MGYLDGVVMVTSIAYAHVKTLPRIYPAKRQPPPPVPLRHRTPRQSSAVRPAWETSIRAFAGR